MNARPQSKNYGSLVTAPGVIAMCLMLTACSVGPRLRDYPTLDQSKVRSIVVVGTMVDGEYLNEVVDPCGHLKLPVAERVGKECISMDPAPVLLDIDVKQTVFGKLTSKHILAATTHHFGLHELQASFDKPLLLYLETDEKSIILRRYAYIDVAQRRDGQYFLIEWSGSPYYWLPCDIRSLRETVNEADFEKVFGRRIESFVDAKVPDKYVGFVEVSKGWVRPTSGISIDKLAAHLKQRESDRRLDQCPSAR